MSMNGGCPKRAVKAHMRHRLALVGVAIALAALVAGITVGYLNQEATASADSTASSIVDLGGQKFLRWKTPRSLPAVAFEDSAGRTLSLSDFRGRVVLLNVWATWCPPCRKEMPSLERLQRARGGKDFEVVALSIDRERSVVRTFYREIGLTALRLYQDPSNRATDALKVVAVPTTLLIDREGREIGRSLGPAEWDSVEVNKLLDEVLRDPSPTTGVAK